MLTYELFDTFISEGVENFHEVVLTELLREILMSLVTILIILLVLILLGILPTWPHSRAWGYGPSGIVGIILVILLILVLLGRV